MARLSVVLVLAVPCSSLRHGTVGGHNQGIGRRSTALIALLRSSPCVQVVTDIDDTIKSSGGVALAGIPLGGVDTSFARGACYPGVFCFGAEISGHPLRLRRKAPAPMAVLTARAKEFRWALELKQSDKICQGFTRAGDACGYSDWGIGPVLYGSVQEWICQERKGWRKYENFKLLLAGNTDPTLRYVFIGDNGSSEKDLEAAEMIVGEYPSAMQAVFMHAVSGQEQPAPLPEDTSIGGVPLRYFRTYATAAVKATRLGLLSHTAARRVLRAIEADMQADPVNIAPGSPNERLLHQELAEAHATLGVSFGSRALPLWARRLRRS